MTDDASALPLDVEAVNMLRRIVAAREMAWLDDEIEGAKNWLVRLSESGSPPEPEWLRELRSKAARYQNAYDRARELVRGSPVDWSTDAAAQEPDGWWNYTSQNNRDVLMAAVASLAAPPEPLRPTALKRLLDSLPFSDQDSKERQEAAITAAFRQAVDEVAHYAATPEVEER